MTTEEVFKIVPICISSVAFVVSGLSLLMARKSLSMSRREFLGNRTVLLTCSIRPELTNSLVKLLESSDPKQREEGRRVFVQGFNNAFLVFIPSLKPNTLMGVTFYFPSFVTPRGSLSVANISAGSITSWLVEQKVIKEGDFAVPALLVTAKLHNYLGRITPQRHKIEYGTLNRAQVPVIADIDLIARGERFKERQLYDLDITYQVSSKDEVLVQQLSLGFQQRMEMATDPIRFLDQLEDKYGVRFLSEPIPAESHANG